MYICSTILIFFTQFQDGVSYCDVTTQFAEQFYLFDPIYKGNGTSHQFTPQSSFNFEQIIKLIYIYTQYMYIDI